MTAVWTFTAAMQKLGEAVGKKTEQEKMRDELREIKEGIRIMVTGFGKPSSEGAYATAIGTATGKAVKSSLLSD